MMIDADFALVHAGALVCLDSPDDDRGPRRGPALGDLGSLPDGAIAAQGGQIVWVGPTDDLKAGVRLSGSDSVHDVRGRVVTPGLVDAHTHPVYAATRPAEFAMRAAGKSYQEIAREGGGIVRSVADTRQSSYDALLSMARVVAGRMLLLGTTTAEAKSGYGLDMENELKMLRVIREIDETMPIDWVPTALPAHSVPPEFKSDPEAYIALLTDEILPAIASAKLAEFNDIFLEEGVFDRMQSERIQGRARDLGFRLKFHVDQLTAKRGAELAVAMGAISADHLEFISKEGIDALAGSDTIAVLLPGTAYFLDSADRPPVRLMIEAGVAVAVATDCNPGSNMSESMPMAMNQACVLYKMSPEEALTAATINAAHAIGRADRIGSLTVGKQCDLVIWDVDDYRELAYHYGVNLAAEVYKKGIAVA